MKDIDYEINHGLFLFDNADSLHIIFLKLFRLFLKKMV